MKLIDISDPLYEEMLRYPSVKPFQLHRLRDYSLGDTMAMTSMEMVIHNGTHLDAPYHYIENGQKIDELPLERFYGAAQVLSCDSPIIDLEQVKKLRISKSRVLFHTPFSKNICENQPGQASYLTAEAAEYLAQAGVTLVGIDSFSVDKEHDKQKLAHKTLLGHGVVLLEGICLEGVADGAYELICFPLRLRGAEGAPCRAVLIEEGGRL